MRPGSIYDALNRRNARDTIFRKDADFEAFNGLWATGRAGFFAGVMGTRTMRYHAHDDTSGEGHVCQGRYQSFHLQDDAHFLRRVSVRRLTVDSRWSELRGLIPCQDDDASFGGVSRDATVCDSLGL